MCRRALALLLMVSTGCSALVLRIPVKEDGGEIVAGDRVNCVPENTWAWFDLSVASVGGVYAFSAGTSEPADNDSSGLNQAIVLTALLLWVLPMGASAVWGFTAASRCAKARAIAAGR